VNAAGPATDLVRLLDPARVLGGVEIQRYAVDGIAPLCAVLPESVSEISAVLHFANERGLAIVPVGGGTMLDLGNKPERFDVALDLRRLDAIVDYSPDDLVVTAQAGLRVQALNSELVAHGQFLALDPPLAGLATLGGVLASGATGPNRLRYGAARDLVIGLTCVLADGQVVHSGGRVVKNVAGYDMNKLYLGSIGSAGIIVETSFKLHPLPAARAVLSSGFPDCRAAHAAALSIINSFLSPTAVELVDPVAARSLGDQRPDGWLLIVEVSGLPEAVARKQREIGAILQSAGGTPSVAQEQDGGSALIEALRDFGRQPESAAALILRCAVLPSEIPDLLERLEPLLSESRPAIVISPGAGLVRSYWNSAEPGAAARIEAIRSAAEGIGGTVTVERCSAELKDAIEIWGVAGADVALMRDLKAIFDPNATLSPGRFVDHLW
jgi:glycolate oxidase FAD binding subunit